MQIYKENSILSATGALNDSEMCSSVMKGIMFSSQVESIRQKLSIPNLVKGKHTLMVGACYLETNYRSVIYYSKQKKTTNLSA